MKRQPKWIAAFFAVLLALCGIEQPVRAQPHVGTYVKSTPNPVSENTVVLRIKPALPGGRDLGVYGSLTRLGSAPEEDLALAITGSFNPATGVLRAVMALPSGLHPTDPADSVVDGTYNEAEQSFTLTFRSRRAESGSSSFQETNIRRYTATTPYVVGIWKWVAADMPASLTSTLAQFSGEFYIVHQDARGLIYGFFSDGSSLNGTAEPTNVRILRRWEVNRQEFAQEWNGQPTATIPGHTESIQGSIKSTQGSGWQGEFFARWDLLR